MKVFKGIWPALVTPSNPDLTINTKVLCYLLDYILDKGVDGFYVGGTTGEGVFMPVTQRKLLVETVVKHINQRVPIIVHVGAVAVDDAIDLAHHARDQGAVGISSIVPPLYHSLNSVVEYYKVVASSVVEIPFMPYLLNPVLDSVSLMQRLLDIPNLAGTKYTGPNMFEFRQILELGDGKWTMFSGMDEQCVYAAMMGATGAIGSTLNFMPGVYKQIHQYVTSGELDKAQDLQVRANQVTQVLIDAGFSGALKSVLSRILAQPVGQPRLPQFPLNDAQIDDLYDKLALTDFESLVALS